MTHPLVYYLTLAHKHGVESDEAKEFKSRHFDVDFQKQANLLDALLKLREEENA